jgi:hypothetical protein
LSSKAILGFAEEDVTAGHKRPKPVTSLLYAAYVSGSAGKISSTRADPESSSGSW